MLRDGIRAAAEFQKCINHLELVPNCPSGAPAHFLIA